VTQIESEIRTMLKARLEIEPGDVQIIEMIGGVIEVRARRGGAPVTCTIQRRRGQQNRVIAEMVANQLAELLGVVPRGEDSGVRALERQNLVAGADDVQAAVLRDIVRLRAQRGGVPTSTIDGMIDLMKGAGEIGVSLSEGDDDERYEAIVQLAEHLVCWAERFRRTGEQGRRYAGALGEVLT
jgi:hypothetical protein